MDDSLSGRRRLLLRNWAKGRLSKRQAGEGVGRTQGSPGPHPAPANACRQEEILPQAGTGTHIPVPWGLPFRPGIPEWHRCPPARWTAAFAPALCQLPILNLGAEKRAPWGCSTSYVASPATQLLGFPSPNLEHQIFQSISCTHAGRLGFDSSCPRRHAQGKVALPDFWCSKWCLT